MITASNGSGKTTLMVCMSRLSDSRAFSNNFVQHRSWNVDSFDDSSITYRSRNSNTVTYTYRSTSDSWRPTTRDISALRDFGYTEIVVIPTLGQRVYIQNQTIAGGRVRPASVELRQAMARVLENPKFLNLRKINLGETRGRGGRNRRNNSAFLLPGKVLRRGTQRKQSFYSESSFSLGEIFTLNLLFELLTIQDNSLIVIDELEVALHPRVQINLLNYLQEIAISKNLTVLISTHSSSIIKCAPNLIYLNSDDTGNVEINYKCYPALALQEVAVEEDIQPDYAFFVEDSSAELLLKEMIKYYFQINPNRQQPLWKILPIGGYPEVLRFTQRANVYLLHRRIGQYCFLDDDVNVVKSNLQQKGNARTIAENTLWELFQSQDAKIKYLNITPELGLWTWISENAQDSSNSINQRFPDSFIDIPDLIRRSNAAFPHAAQNPRDEAKNRIAWLVNEIMNLTNEDTKRIKSNLFTAFVGNTYQNQENRNRLNALFGPIFNRQGN